MILKGFKEKSIKKHLRSLLNKSERASKTQVVDSVGVIVNADEVSDLEMFNTLVSKLNITPNKFKVIAFTETENLELVSWHTCFNPEDIGWRGAIRNSELETFLQTNFDLLISFYTTDTLRLKILTAKSEARFKASIFQGDPRLNDLIIHTPLNDFNAFETELLKYLQVFKILKHEA
ncbi:hypothetical protein BZARG_2300 [Bizionia argentinensis JUB59]|uniref:Uncharacterized protein n=1 Tax=Bizionia argentinensis JUB59 TaxID=1046627 RepID=G2EGP2_9FLAO|nr:hypothetical protein [Bizionia argentinensis]EGV42397.1 hypothetical protein BZARG_2300 [Bizionia argentinensis JUB59]